MKLKDIFKQDTNKAGWLKTFKKLGADDEIIKGLSKEIDNAGGGNNSEIDYMNIQKQLINSFKYYQVGVDRFGRGYYEIQPFRLEFEGGHVYEGFAVNADFKSTVIDEYLVKEKGNIYDDIYPRLVLERLETNHDDELNMDMVLYESYYSTENESNNDVKYTFGLIFLGNNNND